jgi:hypothetical protein
VVVIQPGRLGADGYVGGGNLEELVKRRDEKAFLSDADSTELPDGEEKGEVKVPLSTFPAGTPLAGKSAPAGMLPGRMVKWLSLKFKAPILSNLAARRDGTIGIAQFHRSLREHLTAIASSFPVSMKQRKGILLIQDRSWFTEPTFGTTPFEVVERLRKTFKDTEPSLDVVLRGLSETSGLPEGGCQFLARYFPIAALGDRTAAGLLAYGEQREKKRAGLDQGQAVELSTLSLVSRRRLEALGERDHNAPRFVAGGSLQFQFSAGSDYVRFGYVLKSPSEECKSLPLLRRRTGTAPFLMLPPETDEIVDSRQ